MVIDCNNFGYNTPYYVKYTYVSANLKLFWLEIIKKTLEETVHIMEILT